MSVKVTSPLVAISTEVLSPEELNSFLAHLMKVTTERVVILSRSQYNKSKKVVHRLKKRKP
jgi:hypothetical protein